MRNGSLARVHGGLQIGHGSHEMNQVRTVMRQRGLKDGVVEIEPALLRRDARGPRGRIDGDDLQIRLWKRRARDGQQSVVRTHRRMRAARPRHHAERRLAPLHAFVQRAGGDDEMVDAGVHRNGIRCVRA